jgi:hypothetical protein
MHATHNLRIKAAKLQQLLSDGGSVRCLGVGAVFWIGGGGGGGSSSSSSLRTRFCLELLDAPDDGEENGTAGGDIEQV